MFYLVSEGAEYETRIILILKSRAFFRPLLSTEIERWTVSSKTPVFTIYSSPCPTDISTMAHGMNTVAIA